MKIYRPVSVSAAKKCTCTGQFLRKIFYLIKFFERYISTKVPFCIYLWELLENSLRNLSVLDPMFLRKQIIYNDSPVSMTPEKHLGSCYSPASLIPIKNFYLVSMLMRDSYWYWNSNDEWRWPSVDFLTVNATGGIFIRRCHWHR